MRWGDILAKVARGEPVSGAESEQVRYIGNALQSLVAFSNKVNAISGDVKDLNAGGIRLDPDGITLVPAENSLFNWTTLTWEIPGSDRWYGALGTLITGIAPDRNSYVGLTAQNEADGNGLGSITLSAIGDGVDMVMKLISDYGIIINSTKTTTGDEGSPEEGLFVINTFDNNIQIYADGGWRELASW